MTNKLILVKHSLPEIDPSVPAREWRLSGEGRRRCGKLADRLATYAPDVVASSVEAKAVETGQIVAERLALPFHTASDLHEHDRSQEPFITKTEFEASVADFFAHPNEVVYGSESADQAHARFVKAVEEMIQQHPAQTLVIVAHGTVITLLVSRAAKLPPLPFWKKLDLPSFVVVSFPQGKLLTVAETLG